MDEVKAKDLESALRGDKIGPWQIEKLLGFGKSAAVFRAIGPDRFAAVKVFDDDLIKRYGDHTQFARIERERGLVGKTHPNLVEILDGGVDARTGNHYIVMEYLDGPNLKQCLQDMAVDQIGSLAAQLAAAAKFLEGQGFCHRDIKPENIVVVENLRRLVLLDLGVLRPLIGSNLTDTDGIHPFVGTLQYSSPEFLLRQEEDSLEGWRALTFYQIGGVLHDLIMRRPLFAEFAEPYARLVNAVQHEIPQIQNTAVPSRLVGLARSCLLKNWKTRLSLVRWESFTEPKILADAAAGSAKQRVTTRGALAQALSKEGSASPPADTRRLRESLAREILDALSASVRSIRAENPLVPPLTVVRDRSSFLVRFAGSPEFDLMHDLHVVVGVEVLDLPSRAVRISALGCLGSYEAQAAPEPDRPVFEGVYDTAAAEGALEGCVYDLLDQAQERASLGGNEERAWLAPAPEDR